MPNNLGAIAQTGLRVAGQVAATQVNSNPALAITGGLLAFFGTLYFALDILSEDKPKTEGS